MEADMDEALLRRIAAGRTDLVFDCVADEGDATTETDGTRLIQWCAYYGDVSAVRFLLANGETLHSLGADLGLNAAAFHGYWRLCQFLLEQGAPVEGAPSESGETPLHAALLSEDRIRHDAVVQVLLHAGADANARTRLGVETGALMRDARTRGETPLHRAAAFGGTRTIRMLLDAGARLDARDAHGDTPLSWASWHRRPVDVLRLLCHGPHAIHPDYRGLQAHLLGDPSPEAKDR
jgi:ankyrin repeat protein